MKSQLEFDFDEIIKKKKPVFLSCDRLTIAFQSLCVNYIDHNLVIKNVIPIDLISEFLESTKFYLQISMHRFYTEHLLSDGKDILFPIEHFSDAAMVRHSMRNYVLENENVIFEFLNPYDLLTVVRKKVLDLSDTGLSLALNFDSELFQKDQIFENIKIYQREKKIMEKGKCQVVYKRPLMNEKGELIYQAGIKFMN
jgi:hypothetical protein